MYKIKTKKELNKTVIQMEIEAPLVAKKAKPGQFIILRVNEEGERIPLTVAGVNENEGLVKIIFQVVGGTTKLLSYKKEGESIQDFVGPLGVATKIDHLKKNQDANVTSIIGFRNKDLVILEDEFKACSDTFHMMTDDGSYGREGNVTVPLKEMLENGEKFDEVIAIGPLIMMKFTVLTCKPFNVPCTVSMNPIMIDGTGMCGGCRLTLNVDGKKVTKFACVDGPDFDGYEVDFDEAMSRGRMYSEFEKHAFDDACNLMK